MGAAREKFINCHSSIINCHSFGNRLKEERFNSAGGCRSGISRAPNYAEVRGAESRADFVHKLRIAVKELNETGIWLLIILKARMAPEALVTGRVKENRELACILSASISTAQTKGSQRTNGK